MFTASPSDEELAAAGLRREDFDSEVVEVWPDNWPAFKLLCDLRTQWRMGSSGPIGFDYSIWYHRMDRMGLAPAQYADLEGDMRVMEEAALKAVSERD